MIAVRFAVHFRVIDLLNWKTRLRWKRIALNISADRNCDSGGKILQSAGLRALNGVVQGFWTSISAGFRHSDQYGVAILIREG